MTYRCLNSPSPGPPPTAGATQSSVAFLRFIKAELLPLGSPKEWRAQQMVTLGGQSHFSKHSHSQWQDP